ncbi:MAG: general secretion pathway protein GspB [Nitrospirae bacterium]|nr:general secretion pathway protein GspB [Nitrospirota bacterium]
MSFILDALKKLEQKRQRGSVPDLMTVQSPEQHERKKRPIWVYLLLAALILNAGILTAWLLPRKSGKQDLAGKSIAVQPDKTTAAKAGHESIDMKSVETEQVADGIPDAYEASLKTSKEKQAAKEANPAAKPKDVISKRAKQEQQLQSNAVEHKAPPKQPEPAVPEAEVKASLKTTPETRPPKTSSGKTSKQQPPKENPPAQEQRPPETGKTTAASGIPELGQLPQSVQSELPKLSILGHIYSNSPDTRLVNINGDIYREGDSIIKDLTIEEITETGVVFNYNGSRFRLRAF